MKLKHKNKRNSDSLKISKIDKPLARLVDTHTQITNIRSDKKDITTDHGNIRRIIRILQTTLFT